MPPLVIFIIVVILGLGAFLAVRFTRARKGSWLQFVAKGKDAGFTFKEIELLRKLAVKSDLADPSSLFWSQNQLDVCIRSLVRNLRISGGDQDQGTQDFLSKLYDFRKKIEMEKPRMKNGISSSRQISELQYLRLSIKDAGVFKSKVLNNFSQYLVISRPEEGKIPPNFVWAGQRVSVYFWREDDAGYVFDTDILEEADAKGAPALRIGHSDSLYRTQKRRSVRVKLHKAAFLYPLTGKERPGADKFEAAPGLKCLIEDLSDSGCAVTVGGRAHAGIRVKVQFALDNAPVSMSGTVRSVEYKAGENRSLLHMEADPLSMDARNRIMGSVFGMLPEDGEDLPFRLLNEEVENMSSNQGDFQDNAV
jgi:c-di-GMP-binding flagellar brake protein YcgR